MNLSASLLMPPPMITRSGQSSASSSSTYSARRLLQAFQLRPLLTLIDAAARRSASLPRTCRCPSSVFGQQHAVAEQRRADARAEREHEYGAGLPAARAEAHLGQARGVGVVADQEPRPRHRRTTDRPERLDPRVVDVGCGLDDAAEDHGRKADAGLQLARQLRDEPCGGLDHGLGVAGCGVSTRTRGAVSSPVAVSTIAALMPVPPTSIPIISIRRNVTRASGRLRPRDARACETERRRDGALSSHTIAEDSLMQLGMIGLGRMGANMVRRLHARRPRVRRLRRQRGRRSRSSRARARAARARSTEFVAQADARRARSGSWSRPRSSTRPSTSSPPLLEPGDIVIDGGNCYYRDDIDRAAALAPRGIHYVDVGTSGGVFGLERGYCLMIGGEDRDRRSASTRSSSTLAPGVEAAPRTPGRERRPRARPSTATCTAAATAPGTS